MDSIRRQRPWNALEPNWCCSAQRALSIELMAASDVLVAHNVDDAGHIYGYVVGDADARVMHWLYVKGDFRELGVGTSLMRAMFGDFDDPIAYTQKTCASPHYHAKWHLEYRPHDLVRVLK